MELQKIWDSQSNQEQNEQCWRSCHYRFQEILQSPSNKKQYGTDTKTELQTNKILEDANTSVDHYGHLILGKGA